MLIQGDQQITRPILIDVILTMIAALVFCAFFRFTKFRVISAVSPFAEDPVDTIGSIAIQVAFLVGVITLARGVRCYETGEFPAHKLRLIARGSAVVLASIAMTLVADTITEIQHPSWELSVWGKVLVVGLASVAGVTLVAAIIFVWLLRTIQRIEPPAMSTSAASRAPIHPLVEAWDDLWSPARVALAWLGPRISWLAAWLDWLQGLQRRLPWVERIRTHWIQLLSHPWRFCFVAGLAVGVALATAHAFEDGLPINLSRALPVGLFFVVVETAVTVLGYWTLGGFLGLRARI